MGEDVVARLRERAERFPDRVALLDATGQYSYGSLWERVDRLASALDELGVQKGDAVLAYLPNVREAVECELAVLGSGRVWIALTARLTWAEVRGVVASCAPKVLITDPGGARRVAEGLRTLPSSSLPRLVVTGDPPGPAASLPALGYESLIAAAIPRRARAAVSLADVARLRYTSGTTGGAKAAVLPHRVYTASLDTLLDELGPFTAEDRALHVAPLTHGSGALLYPVFHAGGANVLLQHFDAADVLSHIERHRITTLFTVPTMLSRIVGSPRFDDFDLSSLRALVYGGAPMPEAQLDTAVARLGHALYGIYGMTEAPWPITVLKPVDHVRGSERIRSVGKPSRGYTVRVVGEGGRALGPDEVGEIEVSGRNVMTGYLNDEAATRAVLRDGRLSTRDLGRIDADGYVFIVGRDKDVIISGGFNVYAAEVEAALSAHPGVLESAVVGLPHDDWGEQVVAFVVPKSDASLDARQLDVFVRTRLSGYKCPRQIRVVPDLPKNASGKIKKGELVRRDGKSTRAG